MPSLGPAEILVILVVALMVFGPNRLPEIARQVGKAVREFRSFQEDLRSHLRETVGDLGIDPAGGDPVPSLAPREDPPDAAAQDTDDGPDPPPAEQA